MIHPVRFFEEVKREVKRVTWPSLSETRTATIMVFIMVALAGLFLFTADQVISALIKLILNIKGQ